MPEHHEGTPEHLRDLESFLWWDFDDLQTWRTWIAERGGNASTAQSSFGAALEAQEALRGLQMANSGVEAPPKVETRVATVIARHGVRPRVTLTEGVGFHADQPADLVGRVVGLALQAMIEGSWRRFKICRDQTCRASYFDATRNTGKTWCAMQTCGSRNKMRRFRARTIKPDDGPARIRTQPEGEGISKGSDGQSD